MNTAKQKISDLLALADIKINGSQPWDLIVHNENFYQRVLAQGALGLGESYMDGWWDCQQLDVMITKIIQANIHKKIFSWNLFGDFLLAKIRNSQNRKRAYQVAQEHYDLGNELYQAMLDSEMSYSCAYWQQAANLDQAQSAKLALCCDKLQLKPGARVLDIGCGWGAFARYAASKYHVQVDGITVSQEQVKYNQERNKGLSIDIKLQDYRLLTKEYDAIISIGMFEHVGYKNYQEFMQIVYRCLREGGLFLLHTIGGNTSVYSNDSWTGKYIFP
ncbi:MAG: cyclopropane-fatty-acyl-phospholipid synthase, partial [Candidatus Komeilibacteria bacterium CG_4_9_14_3_um_filter_37_5]